MKTLLILGLGAILFVTPAHARDPRVFIVMEENHAYTEVIGNQAMPYLNSLARSYGLATKYYGVTHPSIGNYFSLTTGQIITNKDSYSSTVYVDNIVRHLIKAGKTWKEYSENLPHVGYFGGNYKGYIQHHNPLSYFTDVRDSIVQRQNLVPFTHLARDIAENTLPNFGFIVPNDSHNAHSGSLAAADDWLRTNIAPLIKTFRGDDLLIVVFDESSHPDDFAGGRIVWAAIGPSIKKQYKSDSFYQHPSTLKFVSRQLGIDYPNAVLNAPAMDEFRLSP